MQARPDGSSLGERWSVSPRERSQYVPPTTIHTIGLWELLSGVREVPLHQRKRLVLPGFEATGDNGGPTLWYSGDINLVQNKSVAIVGSRSASRPGKARARRLARELAADGVVVVSGLAEGVDYSAHEAAIEGGGATIAVIGTPIDKAYPAKHAPLQELIYREHLLISPFPPASRVFRSNFPQRNRVMAALTDATVIIEASDTSGTLHQAAECAPKRLDRWLFIAKSLVDRSDITWPRRFLDAPGDKVRALEHTEDVLSVLR